MSDTQPTLAIAGPQLWRRLSGIEPFPHFNEEQKAAFLSAYERHQGIELKVFGKGDLVCKKGDYELDLCFILNGSADLCDEVAGTGYTKVASLPAGTFYGELGALGGIPRSTDVVAGADDTEILYIPDYALKFVNSNIEARTLIMNRYRDRAVRAIANAIDLFQGVPRDFIDKLIPHCAIERYDLRGITLIKQGDEGDAFYLMREGFVQVVREREDGTKRVTAYIRNGEYFGEMALISGDKRYASVLTAGKCELIKIPKADFLALCKQFPAVEKNIRDTIQRRYREEEQLSPDMSALLEKSGQLGMIQAEALLVMDLDRCVKCDNCVSACESLHGESRLVRTGIQLGRYLVPAACRHCDDPKCMTACPTGAVKRRREGEIYFQYDMCIGCANCSIACPYDNIAMIETPKFDAAQARKSRFTSNKEIYRPYPLAAHDAGSMWAKVFPSHAAGNRARVEPGFFAKIFGVNKAADKAAANPVSEAEAKEHSAKAHIPISFPIKCDLCDGLPFMGCVHSCPTGAAIRIDPATLFEETGAVSVGSSVRKSHGGSD
ncbi:MAG TPA: cyclic nucleotide-binding domain-containing protein [Candidatus Binataceae bacterium]|nr:cyclic nucleotide-binding domain-containing protein [Candidatus Binataceae bacterium]